MSLLVIAYPGLSENDFERIENYRRKHDKFYNIIKPHFTLVFPVADFSIADFTTEIKKQVEKENSFSFCIRCAVINKDAFNESYHTFLVSDEGFSQLIKLHDKLFKHLRFDIDFIPHITICSSSDKMICKKMADEWNSKEFQYKEKLQLLILLITKMNVLLQLRK